MLHSLHNIMSLLCLPSVYTTLCNITIPHYTLSNTQYIGLCLPFNLQNIAQHCVYTLSTNTYLTARVLCLQSLTEESLDILMYIYSTQDSTGSSYFGPQHNELEITLYMSKETLQYIKTY